MTYRLGVLFVFVPFLVLPRCTADTFTAPDTSAGDGGGADGPPARDTGSDDVSASGDNTVPDGGSNFSCANVLPGTVLCDDFDSPDSTSPAHNWTGELIVNGQNSFDTTTFRSSPRSYRAQTLLGDGGAFADAALLVQSLSGISASATLSARAAVRVHAVDPNFPVPVLRINYTASTGASVWAEILLNNDTLWLAVIADGNSNPLTAALGPVSFDVWTLLQIDMQPTKVLASVDGQVTAISATLATPSQSPIPQAQLGILAGTTAVLNVANFDDFLFRIY